ncbi:MAG: hypothetical protein KIT22_07430 [Verrucomicrobiae bacterium]|nr:hypothetical protein [Verrucomicrobiae bacterium]
MKPLVLALAALALANFAGAQSVVMQGWNVPVISRVLFYDDNFLFIECLENDLVRNSFLGIYVHSKKLNGWRKIEKISTKDGVFGHSWSQKSEDLQKLRSIQVGWDFRDLSSKPYVDMPLRMSVGGMAFSPDKIEYEPDRGRYRLGFMTGIGVESAITYLYITRSDLEMAGQESDRP